MGSLPWATFAVVHLHLRHPHARPRTAPLLCALLALATATLVGVAELSTTWKLLLVIGAVGLVIGVVVAIFELRRPGPIDGKELRRALAEGREAEIEERLSKALKQESGVGLRPWLARAQLAELLLALGRDEEARRVMSEVAIDQVPRLARWALEFSRVQVDVLTRACDEAMLHAIVSDRHASVGAVTGGLRSMQEQTWSGLQGLCLARMGRAAEAVPLLEASLGIIQNRPSLVIFLFYLARAKAQLGEIAAARRYFDYASREFPSSPWGARSSDELARLSQ